MLKERVKPTKGDTRTRSCTSGIENALVSHFVGVRGCDKGKRRVVDHVKYDQDQSLDSERRSRRGGSRNQNLELSFPNPSLFHFARP